MRFFHRSPDLAPRPVVKCRHWVIVCLVLAMGSSVAVHAEEFGIVRRSSSYSVATPYQQYRQPLQQAPQLVAPQPVTHVTAPPPVVQADPASKTASQVAMVPKPMELQPTQQAPLPNVVRLIAFDSTGQSFGSGAYIGNYGEYGLILSNWHVVCEADGLVHIHFVNGFSSYGAILTADKKWDLALIAISRPPQSVPLLPVARVLPKIGEPLWIAGYGAGSYRLAGGRCVRYLAPEIPQDGSTPLFEIIELSVSARQGDSGGPILNANQELAGVLFGSDMVHNTAGSGCERVNRFLSQANPMLGTLPSKPENYFLSIEKAGPKRTLQETRTATATVTPSTPKVETPVRRNADFSGSSSQFGVRSGSRRYTQPPAVQSEPSQPVLPVPRPSSEQTPSGSVPYGQIRGSDIRQTGHHVTHKTSPNENPFPIAASLFALTLVSFSFQLLRKK